MKAKKIYEFEEDMNPYQALDIGGIQAMLRNLPESMSPWRKEDIKENPSPNNVLANSFYEVNQNTGYKAYAFYTELVTLAISNGANLLWLNNGDGPSGKHRIPLMSIDRVAIIESVRPGRVYYKYNDILNRSGWKKQDSTTSDFGRNYIPANETMLTVIEQRLTSLRKLKNIIKKHI